MEAFSVFATLSLVDLMSNPLDRIRRVMSGVDGTVGGLRDRMGSLAVAMGPIALGAGLIIGALGIATSKAIAFESAMADVAKVVNFDTQSEFKAMSTTVMDMAGRIPMAADGIAAIIAAAGQSGVAKQDLAEFAEQAAKMGVAFDLTGDQAGKMMSDWRAGMNLTLPQTYALADATNYLSNNMNATAPALGEVIQRVGAAAMSCGLAETQVAALGASFLSAGASPEIAATALKSFTTTLVKGTAMSKDQAAAFRSIGFSATQMAKDMQTNAQGTIFKVLQAIADKPKELQMSLLTQMFGQESIGAIAPLLKNMGLLSQAFELVGDTSRYAGSMQAEFDARSKTTENALQLLSNKLTNLAISIGTIFLPAISAGATFLGLLADGARAIVETPFGQWLVAVIGGVSTLLVSITALSAAMWFFGAVGPMLSKALAPAYAALSGLGAPVLMLIAIAGALYLAYRNNFGGIADTMNRWWKNTTLVVRGVIAIFQNLTGSVFELRGELARDIKAAGLVGLVTSVARIVYRIQAFFSGMMNSLSAAMADIDVLLIPVRTAVADMLLAFEGLFGNMSTSMGGATATWIGFGQVVGEVIGGALIGAVEGLVWLVGSIRNLIDWIRNLVAAYREDLVGAFQSGCGILKRIFSALVSYYKGLFTALSSGFSGVGAAFGRVWTRLESIFAALRQAGAAVTTAFAQIWSALAPVFVKLFGSSVTSGTSGWETFGNVVGTVVVAAIYVLAQAIQIVMIPLEILINGVRLLASLFTGDFAGAADALRGIIASIGEGFALLGDLFGVGDSIRAAWAGVMAIFDGINLFESGAKLLSTFTDGIKSMAMAPVNAVSDALAEVREYLPFSDARTGPLSTLTLSGTRMMTTLGEGVVAGAPALAESVSGALGAAEEKLTGWSGLPDGTGGALSELFACPQVPQTLKEPVSPDVLPVMPHLEPLVLALENLPDLPSLELALGKLPDLPSLELAAGSLPDIPALPTFPQQPRHPVASVLQSVDMPTMPDIPMPAMPKIAAPDIQIPEPPVFAQKDTNDVRSAARGASGGMRTTTITISALNLPGVKDAQDFVRSLRSSVAEYEGEPA